MSRCLSHHPDVKKRCSEQIKAAKKFQMKTQKKFKPLYEQFEKLMGQLVKINQGSVLVIKSVRIFMAAAGKLMQTITDKVQAQLQKIQAQAQQSKQHATGTMGSAMAAAGGLRDKGDELRGQAEELQDKGAQALDQVKSDPRVQQALADPRAKQMLEQVATHFEGLKKLLNILEDGMDKVEDGMDDVADRVSTEVSGKMMMIEEDTMKGGKSAAGGAAGKANDLAQQLQRASGSNLDKMMAQAVASYLCPGGASFAKSQIVEKVDGVVGDDLVSFFIKLADTDSDESLSASELTAIMLSADVPLVSVAGLLIMTKNALIGNADSLPAWAIEACEIVESMLEPLIERVVSFALCVLMLDLREKHPAVQDENYLDGMDDITGKMEMLRGFAEEFKSCLENNELPDATTIFELAVGDSQSLCGGISLTKKLALVKAIVAVGSIDEDVVALKTARDELGEMRTSLNSLRMSSELFPGSVKLQFAQHADSEAYFFWVHCFGEATSEVKWPYFRREFVQHHQRIDPKDIRRILTKLKEVLLKGDESGKETVHVETICKLAARAENQLSPTRVKNGKKSGGMPAPWYDVAAVATKRSMTRARGGINSAGHFSLLSPPILPSNPTLEGIRANLKPPQGADAAWLFT